MVRAVERVRERLLRAAAALEAAGVPYAVTGGNAVAAWAARIDEAAVRNTPDVDLLVRRADFNRAAMAFKASGFVSRGVEGHERFFESDNAPDRDSVRVWLARETNRSTDALPLPDVTEAEQVNDLRVLRLEPLVRMELSAFRTLNHVHLRDLIEVGLVDDSWLSRFPPPLDERLRELLNDPDG